MIIPNHLKDLIKQGNKQILLENMKILFKIIQLICNYQESPWLSVDNAALSRKSEIVNELAQVLSLSLMIDMKISRM